jgi:hypothetical protein
MQNLPKKNIDGMLACNSNTIAFCGGFLYIRYE